MWIHLFKIQHMNIQITFDPKKLIKLIKPTKRESKQTNKTAKMATLQ